MPAQVGESRQAGDPYLLPPAQEIGVNPTQIPQSAMASCANRSRPPLSRSQKFRELMKRMQENRPQDDLSIVKKAYDYSLKHHAGQTRASGEPYLVHPLEVALVLAEMKMDPVAIAAGLLHDSVEDTSVTIVEIRKEFGEQVAHIVEGVTKISKIDFATREEAQAENLRKMMLAMVDDIRVVLIKLADRLHNMRTLEHLPPERQHKIAEETLEIYAPIAHRLGMGKIRGELEDLASASSIPVGYEQVKSRWNARRKQGEAFLAKMQQVIRQAERGRHSGARREPHQAPVQHPQKLQRQQISVDQVYDLLAMRIITARQGLLRRAGHHSQPLAAGAGAHQGFHRHAAPQFLPVAAHLGDSPKTATPFEVQIRTEEMHKMAEEGIAAHWKYKDGPVSAQDEQRLAWLRQVVEWQRDVSDPGEFLSTLKIDLYPEEVYTFTPKGKVVVLPRDATPIDFAYTIHTEVGHTCVGAKVNGRMVPLRHKLRSGDIVEIMTQPGTSPAATGWAGQVSRARATKSSTGSTCTSASAPLKLAAS
jgi:GTP diphosphokinase / guanosine-3',5'-bis(diphosphate) 3'-diphosphatase